MTAHPLKVAIVGLRIHAGTLDPDKGHGLIKSFKAHPDVQVVAYCEWAPEEAAALAALQRADPAAAVYASVAELLASADFDAAVIMLPPPEALAAALQLAAAGKHFFVEKQIARTSADLAPLRELVAQRGLVVQVGYPWVGHPASGEIKRLIDGGILGRLMDVEIRHVTIKVAPGLRDPAHWLYRPETEGGGMLHMEGGHWLTLLRFFTSAEVRSLVALCSRVGGYIAEGLEDVSTVAMEMTSGAHVSLHMGYLLPGVGPRDDSYLALRGTLGTATWRTTGPSEFTVSSTAPAWRAAPVRTFTLPATPRAVYANEWGFQFASAFVRAVREGTPVPLSLEDGWRVLQIVDAAYESCRTGRRIDLD